MEQQWMLHLYNVEASGEDLGDDDYRAGHTWGGMKGPGPITPGGNLGPDGCQNCCPGPPAGMC